VREITLANLRSLAEGSPPKGIGMECADVIPFIAQALLDIILNELSAAKAVDYIRMGNKEELEWATKRRQTNRQTNVKIKNV